MKGETTIPQVSNQAIPQSAASVMTEHAVVIAGAGPTGLMLAGELALAGIDVAIFERRASPELNGSLRVFTLLHDARPVLINLGEPGGIDIAPWSDRVQSIDARYDGAWELPLLGPVTAPTAVLIRPDGYVAWVGCPTQLGLVDALTTWFGPPAPAKRNGRISSVRYSQ